MSTLEKTFALLLLAASLFAIYLLQPILMPFLVGIALAYLGDPIVDRLETFGLSRVIGVLIVFVVFLMVFVGSLLIVVPVLIRETGALIRDIPAFVAWLQQTTSPYLVELFGVDPFDLNLDSLKKRITSDWQETGGIVGRILSKVTASGVALLATIANIALTPVVAFYMLRDWDHVMLRIREMIPRDLVDRVVSLMTECDEVLSAFLRGQMLIMILLGCIYAMGLTLIGLKLAFLIGMVAGLASIVPYLGFFVGIIAASLAALFQFQDAIHLLYVGVIFGLGQMIEGMVLTPWLVGDRIGLHPVAVIFAVLAGGQLFGFVGVLLALPVAAVIMVFVRHLHLSYLSSEYYE
ncbi:MAG: AI-2E family transporter [Gammaproteobacteria bacterium]|jgi:predicted PurR-regulated permease PerM|nr:AI-2E family transporter [Gammaproteobacteria bacterium]|tara:strand:+ start:10509 stop:11558 length:1050 start_codon:yes stop_codon:yes gene_type:complete